MRRISIDDAVALALENNLDLQVERLSPQIQDLSVAQVRTGYAPTFRSTIDFNDQTQPPASFLSGNTNQIVGNNAGFDFGLGALNKWGGNYNASFNNTRATTNNIFTNFNPQLSSNITPGLHAAAAAQLQDRRHAPAAADHAEQPRDLGRPAAAEHRAHASATSRAPTTT